MENCGTMPTITFDTLKFAQRLEKAGATREYAAAEAEALSEVFESGTQDLATKNDLREMELRMTIKLGSMMASAVAITAALVKLL